MAVPDGLRYAETHEWFDPETGRAGITEFAADELGEVVYVDLPDAGVRFEAGERFGAVESIKAVSDLYAPVSGEVGTVNDALAERPEVVNESPYGAWMVVFDASPDAGGDLLTAAQYRERTA
jgi:glycine cleavage system H protein